MVILEGTVLIVLLLASIAIIYGVTVFTFTRPWMKVEWCLIVICIFCIVLAYLQIVFASNITAITTYIVKLTT